MLKGLSAGFATGCFSGCSIGLEVGMGYGCKFGDIWLKEPAVGVVELRLPIPANRSSRLPLKGSTEDFAVVFAPKACVYCGWFKKPSSSLNY